MTQWTGLIGGAVVGILAWLFVHGYIIFTLAPDLARGVFDVTAGIAAIASVVLLFWGTKQDEAVLSPTADYFVYGFTTGYVLIPIGLALLTGQLPTP